MNHIYLVNALVTDADGRMLAVRKKKSKFFQMVGGKREEGEELLETLRREFLEEINVDILLHSINFLGEHTSVAVNEENTVVHANVFHVNLKSLDELKIASEIDEMAWITKQTYKDYQLAHLLEEFSLPIWLEMEF